MTEADTLPDLSKWKPRGKRISKAGKAYLATNGVKWCPKCRSVKPLASFSRSRSRSDGLSDHCKACSNESTRRWQAANPDKAAEAGRRSYETARRLKKAAVYFQHRTEYLKPLAAYALRRPRGRVIMFASHTVDALCAWYVGDITLEELQEELRSCQ